MKLDIRIPEKANSYNQGRRETKMKKTIGNNAPALNMTLPAEMEEKLADIARAEKELALYEGDTYAEVDRETKLKQIISDYYNMMSGEAESKKPEEVKITMPHMDAKLLSGLSEFLSKSYKKPVSQGDAVRVLLNHINWNELAPESAKGRKMAGF